MDESGQVAKRQRKTTVQKLRPCTNCLLFFVPLKFGGRKRERRFKYEPFVKHVHHLRHMTRISNVGIIFVHALKYQATDLSKEGQKKKKNEAERYHYYHVDDRRRMRFEKLPKGITSCLRHGAGDISIPAHPADAPDRTLLQFRRGGLLRRSGFLVGSQGSTRSRGPVRGDFPGRSSSSYDSSASAPYDDCWSTMAAPPECATLWVAVSTTTGFHQIPHKHSGRISYCS
jgi:hypothetical protein